MQDIAPSLYGLLRQNVRVTRTVSQGLENAAWAIDIGPELSPQLLQEYLVLWDKLVGIHLDHDREDLVHW